MSVVVEISPAVAFDHIKRWEHWNTIGLVAKKEYDVSEEEYQRLLPEYQKFLALVVSSESSIGMFSGEVDKLWHAHLLYSKLYLEFCYAFNGGQVIHHIPNLSGIKTDGECLDLKCLSKCKTPPPTCSEDCKSDERTPDVSVFRAAYIAAFGPIATVWNLPVADGIAS